MEIISIILRTIFFYFFIILAYRIMGKREIGQLGIIDLIVSILIAELVALSIEDIKVSIYTTIFPIIVLVILELLLATISIKSKTFRKLFSGTPSLIISDGKINYREMVKQRYNLDDLLFALRQRSVKSIEEIDYAVLEANGMLSVFKKNKDYSSPMPLILDGEIQYSTLKSINKDEAWLNNILENKKVTADKVFYAFYKKRKLFIIKKVEVI